MKKVLFVLPSVGLGGTATSLLNLLSLWDSDEYEADLFLMQHAGPFLQRAKTLRLLPEERIISSVLCNKSELKKKGLSALLIRIAFTMAHRIYGVRRTTRWFYQKSARKLSGKYDVVVAYQESQATEYAQYIEAPSRVAWCHMDYHAFSRGKSVSEQKHLYDQYGAIACVSKIVKQSMIDNLHIPASKLQVVYNTIPPLYIRETAEEEGEPIPTSKFTFVSSGRFVRRKRFDRIIKAAAALRDKSIDFRWYLLGDGEEYATIKQAVSDCGLEDHVILTGAKSNPFRYIGKADCFVMTSESEGQPMVLNEAMTLGVPVITTEFPSAKEVVRHGVNALISPNTDDDLVQTVLRFVDDKAIRDTITQGAISFRYDNDTILRQIVDLLKEAYV